MLIAVTRSDSSDTHATLIAQLDLGGWLAVAHVFADGSVEPLSDAAPAEAIADAAERLLAGGLEVGGPTADCGTDAPGEPLAETPAHAWGFGSGSGLTDCPATC